MSLKDPLAKKASNCDCIVTVMVLVARQAAGQSVLMICRRSGGNKRGRILEAQQMRPLNAHDEA
jgi:hypothetical protein